MANRGPNHREDNNEGYGNVNNFERNKYRQTMPSRFNPISPPDHRNQQSNPRNGPCYPINSPTQSHVSTATTYQQPWNSQPWNNSPRLQALPNITSPEPRFRRTHSMAAKKTGGAPKNGSGAEKTTEEDPKADRPKINFMELGKKFTSKFKKNNSQKKGDRMSAPVIKLLGDSGATSSTSQPQLKSTATSSSSPTKKKTVVVASAANMKMQPEDRMKMFQKMGREQSLKMTNVQRMQRERQRDFTLVPGLGKASLEANKPAMGSDHSINSMLVFNTTPDSRRSTSLSMTDDDVEPVFMNALTNKNVTSAQFKSHQKQGGPSFTSTPRFAGKPGLQADSPTISNVRSISEASLVLMTADDTNTHRTDATMYYSTDTLNKNHPVFRAPNEIPSRRTDVTLASTASTPTASSSGYHTFGAKQPADPAPTTIPLKKAKQEVIDNPSSSDCPSFSSPTPTSDLEGLPQHQQNLLQQGQQQKSQPEHLNTLWMVSKEIRDNQIQLERVIPALESMRSRAMSIDQQRMKLFETKGDNPSVDDLRRLWNLDREYIKINNDMNVATMAIQNANNLIPFLEMRRNQLLSGTPPPLSSQPACADFQQNGGSLV